MLYYVIQKIYFFFIHQLILTFNKTLYKDKSQLERFIEMNCYTILLYEICE